MLPATALAVVLTSSLALAASPALAASDHRDNTRFYIAKTGDGICHVTTDRTGALPGSYPSRAQADRFLLINPACR